MSRPPFFPAQEVAIPEVAIDELVKGFNLVKMLIRHVGATVAPIQKPDTQYDIDQVKNRVNLGNVYQKYFLLVSTVFFCPYLFERAFALNGKRNIRELYR